MGNRGDQLVRQEFPTDGKDLYDLLVAPLTGDFNRIKANGAAWNYARDSLVKVGENLRENEHKLTSSHWHGRAADNLKAHIQENFAPQLEMAGAISRFLGKGFETIGQKSLEAGRLVADRLIPKVFEMIGRLARKLMPSGLFSIAWDFVTSGFEFPFKRDVEVIKGIINTILELHKAIHAVCEVAKSFASGVVDVVEGFKKNSTDRLGG